MREVKARSHEYELECTSVSKELVTWKSRYDELLDESQALSAELTHAKPKLTVLEPQFERLNKEKSTWLSERDKLEDEVRKYKVFSDYIEELTVELENADEYKLETEHDSAMEGSLGLAKKHAMWCGLPALRRLSPSLYDRIRGMFQDLHRTEVDLNQLQKEHAQLTKTHAKALEAQQHAANKWIDTEEKLINEIRDLQGCMEALENQVDELKLKKELVNQIRSILRSALEMSRENEHTPAESGGSFISNQSPVPKVSYSHDIRQGRGGAQYVCSSGGYDLDGSLDQVQLEELAAISLPSTPESPSRKNITSSHRAYGSRDNRERKSGEPIKNMQVDKLIVYNIYMQCTCLHH